MSNYPDGMTKSDWKHIDGEIHHRLCPWHDEYEHDCSSEAKQYLRPEFSPPCWVLEVKQYQWSGYVRNMRVDYCPWCGEDLGRPDCVCAT